ncbi:bone morphogenetic protein 2 [Hyalella azteca]|uniref:Bone morphogenetic protein 2 n=1 Tax=Hyalella azteca TaxID=294128 RepID=A0A979FUA1_HYAAZ|nr:bone morphogenetic protein 2 [Hyalella azteca]
MERNVRWIAILLLVVTVQGISLPFPSTDELLQKLDVPGREGRRMVPPQAMLDLYSRWSQDPSSDEGLRYGATTITAITSIGGGTNEFLFMLPTQQQDEQVVGVEFHLHHHHIHHHHTLHHQLLKVTAQVQDTNVSNTQLVSDPSSGWLVFQLASPATVARIINVRTRSVTVRTHAHTQDGGSIHFKSHPQGSLLLMFSKTRAVGPEAPSQLNHLQQDVRSLPRSKRSLVDDQQNSSACSREPLRVDFARLGWSWIIAPTSFDAYFCSGSCSFPLTQDVNPSNHAILRSLIHNLGENDVSSPHNVSPPYCVPTSYTSLTVLHYDEDRRIILKKFSDMVVNACGCR